MTKPAYVLQRPRRGWPPKLTDILKRLAKFHGCFHIVFGNGGCMKRLSKYSRGSRDLLSFSILEPINAPAVEIEACLEAGDNIPSFLDFDWLSCSPHFSFQSCRIDASCCKAWARMGALLTRYEAFCSQEIGPRPLTFCLHNSCTVFVPDWVAKSIQTDGRRIHHSV